MILPTTSSAAARDCGLMFWQFNIRFLFKHPLAIVEREKVRVYPDFCANYGRLRNDSFPLSDIEMLSGSKVEGVEFMRGAGKAFWIPTRPAKPKHLYIQAV